MLREPKITAFLPTVQPKQAKQFYKNILGLRLVSEDKYAIEFEGRGALLRITIVDEFKPQPFAVLGFRIKEIVTEVKALTKKRVKFEKYDSLNQDELGIWTSPSQAKIAWFKDPDGNLLSITEYAL